MAKTECKCPMCKRLHMVDTEPLSPARPWIYCKDCNPKAAAKSGGLNSFIPYSGRQSARIGAE